MRLVKEELIPIILNALKEDIEEGDITTALLFEKDIDITANITAQEDCIIAGIDVARWVFNSLNERLIFTALYTDGAPVQKGKKVLSIKGSGKVILTGERTALNFLGRLSGIATLTNKFVEDVKGTKAKIYDTRKTAPGLRVLEKYAVKVGKGYNYRIGLWDGVLIKDNHIDILRNVVNGPRSDSVKEAVTRAKGKRFKKIEIEVKDLDEFKSAMESGADIIMLDNIVIEDIKKVMKLKDSLVKEGYSKPIIEVSGGVTRENVAKIANLGVDRISIGELTHSADSIDFSLGVACQDFN